MRVFLVFAVALFGINSVGFGDETKLKSAPAEAAIAKCEKAIAEAEKAEKKAEALALKELVTSLEKAMVLATKAGDLPEANALDQKIKQAKGRIDKLNDSTPKPLQFEVFGNKGWQKLGRVVKGQHLDIAATGQWTDNAKRSELSCGPDGLDGRFRLVAQINGNNGFTIGSHLDLIVPESGAIEFGMADSEHVAGGGKLIITITLLNEKALLQ